MPHESCEPYFESVLPLPRETVIELATRVVSEAREQRRALDLCTCGHVHTNRIGYVHKVCAADDCRCEGFTPHPQPKEVSPGAVVPRRGDAAREAAARSLLGPVLVQAGGLGRCIFRPSCENPRALGSQFCLDHDPTRSAPAPILDEPATAPVATPGDAQLLADHYFSGAGMRARLFMLPSGRWHADVTGPGGRFCAISTPDVDKAVYFVVRRLRGAL